MRVHVLGGSGFLGGHVIPLLRSHGHDVTALARSMRASELVDSLGATAVPGDLDDAASIDEALAAVGADALVCLASLGFGHAPPIVSAAENAGIRRAVFVSTTAVMTALQPASKAVRLAAEETIRTSSLEWTVIRPTMIYGTPRDRNMARLLQLVRRSPVVPLPGGGKGLQQPVHVDDLAAAIIRTLEVPQAVGSTYSLAGPEPLPLREVARLAANAVGRKPRFVSIPLRPTIVATAVYERLSRRPRLRSEQVARLAEDKAFNIEPAAVDLGYRPRSFEAGIAAEAALLR